MRLSPSTLARYGFWFDFSLHNFLMKPSKKDEWHRGNYKQHANSVEAIMPDALVK